MSAIQITLDYLDELRALDPDVEFSVTVYSTKIKLEEKTPCSERVGTHGEFAWTLDSRAMFLHMRNDQKPTLHEVSSDAP
jgi:hypothetical protein